MDTIQAGDLIALIALCVAAFSFLSSYLDFPRSLLDSAMNLDVDNEDHDLKDILYFFYELDFYSSLTLISLILTMLTSILFLMKKIQWTSVLFLLEKKELIVDKILSWILFVVSVVYAVLTTLLFLFVYKRRKDEMEGAGRWLFERFLVFVAFVIVLLYSSFPGFSQPALDVFFVTVIMIPIYHLSGIILALRHNPITALIRLKRKYKETQ